jgi:hypothetical protein
MLDLRQFTERHGYPGKFIFKGQCYRDSSVAGTNCRLCGHRIRFVYLVHDPAQKSAPIGSCCFKYFEKWNPRLFDELLAATLWLDATLKGVEVDTRLIAKRDKARELQKQWKALRREAVQRIREYRRATGKDWLPENLFILQEEVELRPPTKSSVRWYSSHINALTEKIQNKSQ